MEAAAEGRVCKEHSGGGNKAQKCTEGKSLSELQRQCGWGRVSSARPGAWVGRERQARNRPERALETPLHIGFSS